MTITDKEIDRVLHQLGGYTRWQMIVYFICCFLCISAFAFSAIIEVFAAAETPHHCTIPVNSTINDTIPWDNTTGSFSSCFMFDEDGEEVKCTSGWTYPEGTANLISQFDLVCDRSYVKELSQSVYLIGGIVGSIVGSVFADLVGRKPVFFVTTVLTGLFCFAVGAAQDPISYVVLRFFVGVVSRATVSGFTLCLEMFAAEYRTFAGIGVEYVWCGAMFLMILMAYFITNWRYIQILSAIPCLLIIPMWWIIHESIPWLVANGRTDDAKQVIEKIAKFNKIPVPALHDDEEMKPMTSPETGSDVIPPENKQVSDRNGNKHSSEEGNSITRGVQRIRNAVFSMRNRQKNSNGEKMSAICKSRRMMIITLILCVLWFVNALVYWGLVLSVETLFPGDLYVNFTLTTASEVVAYIAVHFIARYGRKKPLIIFHVSAGISLIVATFIPATTADGTNLTPLAVTFGLVCKFSITGSFAIIYFYTSELLPTNLRSSGFGLCNAVSVLASVVAPFSGLVAKEIPWLPGVVFGILSLVAGIACFPLPDTVNRPLPETIKDVENWTKKGERAVLGDHNQKA